MNEVVFINRKDNYLDTRSMLKAEIIKLRKQGCTYNEIREQLNCTRSVISYHCKKEGLAVSQGQNMSPSDDEIDEMSRLRLEGYTVKEVAEQMNWSTFTVTKYSSAAGKRKKPYSNAENVQRWRKRTKQRLVEYKGGECIICGYDKCIHALEFHHITPEEKKFHLSHPNTRSLKLLKEEADKCILVCSNCHREIEYEVTDIPNKHCSVH